MDWSMYEEALNINGNNYKERTINKTKYNIQSKAVNSLSYKEVLINNIETNLIINSTNDEIVKKINTIDETCIKIGDYITWNKTYWIITSVDVDNQIFMNGKMQQCNHLFKFQNFNSDILEYWGIIANPYSNTVSDSKTVTIPSNKITIKLPYNDDTRKIYLDKRFVIEIGVDSNGNNFPIVYKIVGIDSESCNYGSGKLLSLVAELDTYNSNDNIEHMIADYIFNMNKPTDESNLLKCEIIGNSEIRVGGNYREYKAVFYNLDATVNQNIIPVWDISALDNNKIIYQQNENFIKIKCEDYDSLIGENITLTLSDADKLYSPYKFDIRMVSLIG